MGNFPVALRHNVTDFFGSSQLDVLIMELHGNAVADWDDLGTSERYVLRIRTFLTILIPNFMVVQRACVCIGKAAPQRCRAPWRSRTEGGGFVLLDFTKSALHNCPDGHQLEVQFVSLSSYPACLRYHRISLCMVADLSVRK